MTAGTLSRSRRVGRCCQSAPLHWRAQSSSAHLRCAGALATTSPSSSSTSPNSPRSTRRSLCRREKARQRQRRLKAVAAATARSTNELTSCRSAEEGRAEGGGACGGSGAAVSTTEPRSFQPVASRPPCRAAAERLLSCGALAPSAGPSHGPSRASSSAPLSMRLDAASDAGRATCLRCSVRPRALASMAMSSTAWPDGAE